MGQLAKGTRGTTWTRTREPNKAGERELEIQQDRTTDKKYLFRLDGSRTTTTIDFSRTSDAFNIGSLENVIGEALYTKMNAASNFDLIAEFIYLAKIKLQEQTE